jgi:hypothetical protein
LHAVVESVSADECMPEIVKRSSAWRKREDTGARLVHAVDFENKIVDQNKIAARQNGGGAESPDG